MRSALPSESVGRRGARALWAAVVAVVVTGLILGFWASTGTNRSQADAPALVLPEAAPADRFARVTSPRAFRFPQDHGPHLEYQTEWWYYTGNLAAEDGSRFAFQLTFFRRGLSPGEAARESPLAANQIYFAHFALTDEEGGEHSFAERFSRGAAGLAGGREEPFRVWLEDWSVQAIDDEGRSVRLAASEPGWSIDLTATSDKPIVEHGDSGVSAKSEEPGNASYYLSFTRMMAEGLVTVGERAIPVRGEIWFDHEWSTSALGPQAVGWDWFGLQLDDGRELMAFLIRREDGTVEPVSGGTLVEADGATRRLAADDIQVEVLDHWTSPHTGAVYPAHWRLSVPSASMELVVEPLIADQEMRVSFVYWEGGVRLQGTSNGAAVGGYGFVELTGYLRSMQGVF